MTSFCYLLKERSTARLGGTGQCLHAFVFSIAVVILWTSVGSAQPPDETENRLITIMAPDEQIRLASEEPILPFAVPNRSDWPTQGVFTIHATSFLPSWGVSIAAESLQGTSSILPPERIWVETNETRCEFMPLIEDVPVMVGEGYAPVCESEVRLSVRPVWSDPAGPYSGQIVFKPYVPSIRNYSMSNSEADMTLGLQRKVAITFDIPVMIELSVSQATLSFDAVHGPGIYEADSRLELSISTNARQWQVVCDALPFRHTKVEDWIIPLDRVRWRLGCFEPPDEGSWEELGESSIIFKDEGPVSGHHLCISFRVEVLSTDPAGTYVTEVTLRGEVL